MTARLIRKRTPPKPVVYRCGVCKNEIDPDYCWCGSRVDEHTMGDGHGPVPLGCTCGYEEPLTAKVTRD